MTPITSPWPTSSPSETVSSTSWPLAGDGRSMVALSDSRVSRLSSFSTLSPWATSTSMTGTLSKSPISGTTISFLLLMTFSLAGMRTEPHVRITKTQTQSYRNRADSALSFFFFSRSQAQPAALLVKIQVAQKTHAQQHGIAVCGADGDCHIMAHNVSQLHLPCAGHPAADRSGCSFQANRNGAFKPQLADQIGRHGHQGGAGIDQKPDWPVIDPARRDKMPFSVGLQNHFCTAIDVLTDRQ